jgi:hypothetical protein
MIKVFDFNILLEGEMNENKFFAMNFIEELDNNENSKLEEKQEKKIIENKDENKKIIIENKKRKRED